jgi:hypothetical protein
MTHFHLKNVIGLVSETLLFCVQNEDSGQIAFE